jgi:hypothetical protein
VGDQRRVRAASSELQGKLLQEESFILVKAADRSKLKESMQYQSNQGEPPSWHGSGKGR